MLNNLVIALSFKASRRLSIDRASNRFAEALHSFMERCLDPLIPASLHSIPQKYSLPNRLWKTSFLLLLDRLQAALPSNLQGATPSNKHSMQARADGRIDHVLDHLTEFIYYAYTFYTHLLEQQSLAVFRSTWLEQLGDVAQYRLKVAELHLRLKPASEAPLPPSSAVSSTNPQLDTEQDLDVEEDRHPTRHKIVPEPVQSTRKQLISRKERKKGFAGVNAKAVPEDMELAETPGNSIGAAAINDWDLIEQDVWKGIAQEWYFLGLSETPGTGRLHSQLGDLSSGDELRVLYHLVKRLGISYSRPAHGTD